MEIAIVSDLYPPEVIGGAEKHAADDAEKLADKGHTVTVVTTGAEAPFQRVDETETNGVTVRRFRPVNAYAPIQYQDVSLPRKLIGHGFNLWNPHADWMVEKQLNDIDPDIVHVHNYRGLSGAVFSAVGRVDAPAVLTLHDYAALHLRSGLFKDGEIIEPGSLMKLYQRYIDPIISDNVDMILSPSQFVIDRHHDEGVFTDVPTQRLQLGIDESELQFEDVDTGNTSETRLLYAGQLNESKGIDVLIDAVKSIDSSDISLHVLGKGPEREALEARADDDDRIEFHGFVSESELVRQYSLADFTVVPSRWYDNSPMVIYESYARGTPVIGADIGGIPELIESGETGYCFEPDQPEALAERIVSRRDEAAELASNVEEIDVSLDTHVARLVDTYESLVDGT